MKNHKKWLSALAIIATVGLLVYWYIASTPYRQAERLIDAIEAEDVDRVREMLESGVDPDGLTASELGDFFLGIVESSARQPVSEACFTGNVELVRLMLEYGASANANEIADWSPIEGVLRQYDDTDLEMLQLLVEYGADTTYQGSEFSYEPVFEAARMWPITDDGYSEDDAKGITELVIYLLGDRSVNIQDERNGHTLLFAAVPSGNFYLVNYLIDHGADVHIVDHYGHTAYSYAIRSGHTEIAELLKP